MRERFRLLALAPWRRAPRLILRAPVLFAGVGAAAVVLGLAAGSRPVFVSSAASAALRQDLSAGCPFDVGLRVQDQVLVPGVAVDRSVTQVSGADLAAGTSALDRAVSGGGSHVATPVVTVFGGNANVLTGRERPGQNGVQLIARTGSTQHVRVIRSVPGQGVWLPDTTAAAVRATAGDTVKISVGGAAVPLVVTGVFRDLTAGRDQFWCSMDRSFAAFGTVNPLPVALVDQPQLLDILRQAQHPEVVAWWEYPPVARGWTLSAAKATASRLGPVATTAADPSSPLGRVLPNNQIHFDLPASITHAQHAASTVAASIGPVALASVAVTIVVIIAAGGLWLDRRRTELTVLALRGAGPGLLGAKAAIELALPVLAGTAVGLLGAFPVVAALGPSRLTDRSAATGAVLACALGAVTSLIVVGGIVAARSRRLGTESTGPGSKDRLFLWEPMVLAVAAASYYELRTRGSAVVTANNGDRVDSLLLLFPVLLLAGLAGLLSRLVLSRPVLHAAARRLPTAGWLAARRLQAGRLRAVPMVTGAAVSIGIVIFGGTLATSLRTTVRAKTNLPVGAAQVFTLQVPVSMPAGDPLAGKAARVTRTMESSALYLGHRNADVLGVDPATFAHAAFWDPSFAHQSLPSLLRLLDSGDASGAIPVLTVGHLLPDTFTVTVPGDTADNVRFDVRVVGRARAFPGERGDNPLVVLNQAALSRLGVTAVPELWVASKDPGVAGRLAHEGVPIVGTSTPDDTKGSTLEPQLWALRYLQVIGLAAGAVTVCGVGLYFAANGRRRRLSATLAARLGLRSTTAWAATGTEVGALLATGLALGVGISLLAVRIIFVRLDPEPNSPPTAIFRLDGGSLAVCLLGAAAAGLLLTFFVERSSSKTSLPAVLRDAD